MGRRSREKGKRWERVVKRTFSLVFEGVYRGDQRTFGGAGPGEGADIEGTPWWLEAKHEYTSSIWAALRQAREKKAEKEGEDRPTVVIAKIDKKPPGWRLGKAGEPPVAAMELPDFLDLVEDWARLKKAAGETLEAPKQVKDWSKELKPWTKNK